MSHTTCMIIIVLGMVCPMYPVSAQEDVEVSPLRNEFLLGVGAAFPGEQHPLNTAGEARVPTSVGVNLAYLYRVTPEWGIGLRMVGYFVKTPSYTVQLAGESFTRDLAFTLTSINIGGEVRYSFTREGAVPYAFGIVNYVGGSVQNDVMGTLNSNGFSGGVGVGVSLPVGGQFSLGFEGVASFGTAKWKQKPFENSSGTAYDPSMFGLFVNASYRWD